MNTKKLLGAVLSSVVIAAPAFAEDTPAAPKKEETKKADKKAGEKSCSGEKGCSGKKDAAAGEKSCSGKKEGAGGEKSCSGNKPK